MFRIYSIQLLRSLDAYPRLNSSTIWNVRYELVEFSFNTFQIDLQTLHWNWNVDDVMTCAGPMVIDGKYSVRFAVKAPF